MFPMEHPVEQQGTPIQQETLSPTDRFFLRWGEIHGTSVPSPLPTDPEGKYALSMQMLQMGKRRLVEHMGVQTIHEKLRALGYIKAQPTSKLIEAIELETRRDSLDTLRKKELHCTDGIEHLVAENLQRVVSLYSRNKRTNYPSVMIQRETMNCVGASLLGGALLEKLNISHLHASVRGHVLTVLVTSEKKVFWHDMLYPQHNHEIQEGDIRGATVQQITDLIDYPTQRGVHFEFTAEEYRKKVRTWREGAPMRMGISPPNEGQHSSLLVNTGNMMMGQRTEEALEAYKIATYGDPLYPPLYCGLGNALSVLGKYEEALEAYERALAIEPDLPEAKKGRVGMYVKVYGG